MKRDTILTLRLPTGKGPQEYAVREPRNFERPKKPFTRKAFAAAHVVADPLSAKEPWLDAAIDWDATLAYRRHLWSWGFGVAEAASARLAIRMMRPPSFSIAAHCSS